MDDQTKTLASQIVTPNHLSSGLDAYASVQAVLRSMVAQRSLPEIGLPDAVIQFYLDYLALLDSNNFLSHAGAGEREGRVINQLVARRNFGMTHGIGRSGDLVADQPKAAGSSLLYKLTNLMVTDLMRSVCGMKKIEKALVVPLATGMSLDLVFMALRASRPSSARYVIWSRIDQKTCFKCILSAGLVPHIVELSPDASDPCYLSTSVSSIRSAVELLGGADNILCVLSTTSCFAPRLPDDVLAIARLCHDTSVPHVINNAYGLQSPHICKRIEAAMTHGRVDAIVQSTDKNFLVPVGGAVIASPSRNVIKAVSEVYPGRASGAPIVDVFITLLGLGRAGYRTLCENRMALLQIFHDRVRAFAETVGETVHAHTSNDVSFYMTLDRLPSDDARLGLGGDLFRHGVSGPRVVVLDGKQKTVSGHTFTNYGAHYNGGGGADAHHRGYIAMACGIGMENAELETFVARLSVAYKNRMKGSKD
eukprot:PhM_4_TR17480/c0_g1_i1/m.66048/K03341/SEPSECS; O-phospho-L-seryl-tRNASec:L-selenocysteinyl-tRNA synthase